MKTINQQLLADQFKRGCDNPGCSCHGKPKDEMFMVPPCHPEAGMDVKYNVRDGLIKLFCHACDKPLDQIMVSDKEVQSYEGTVRGTASV